MKKISILLGILVGLAAPFSVQASPDSQTANDHNAKTRSRAMADAARPHRRVVVYYITSNTAAGSHIPTVVRQSNGHNEALNGGFLPDRFFTTDGGRSNGNNVGTSLAQLDPAITVR